MTSQSVDVSILVPTKNGEQYIRELLDMALHRQATRRRLEAIVVDSGSRDRTREIAAAQGARVLEIPPERFNHGLTRNLLAQQAAGKYLVYLTQDATPADGNWLESLLQPMDEDVLVAGVYSAHRPRPDCDPITRFLIENEWKLTSEHTPRRVNVIYDWRDYEANRVAYVYFANTSAAIRRSVWEEIPFREMEFAEDADWAMRALEAGYETIFEPHSVVIHSHSYTARDTLRRHYEHARAFRTTLGVVDQRPLMLRLWDALILGIRIAQAKSTSDQRAPIHEVLGRLGAQEIGGWLGAHEELLPSELRNRLELQRARKAGR